MSADPVASERRIGAELRLTLDPDKAARDDLHAEFVTMTATAFESACAKEPGLTKDAVAARSGGLFGNTTVSNYTGATRYHSFPRVGSLKKYLEICGFTAEQVEFAVSRCRRIQQRFSRAKPTHADLPSVVSGTAAAVRTALTATWRDSTVKVPSPGRIALRAASENLRTPPQKLGTYAGPVFVQAAYKSAGFHLPDTSFAQAEFGEAVRFADLEPGDLVVFQNCCDSGIYAGDGHVLVTSVLGDEVLLRPLTEDMFLVARRIEWERQPLASPSPSAADTVDVLAVVETVDEAHRLPANVERAVVRTASKTSTAIVERPSQITDPGQGALKATEHDLRYPFADDSTEFVRAAFRAGADASLQSNLFDLPVWVFPVGNLQLQLGNIVHTTSGVAGIFAGDRELVYLDSDGFRASRTLSPEEKVAAWRVIPEQKKADYGDVLRVEPVELRDRVGGLLLCSRTKSAPAPRPGDSQSTPTLGAVFAFVIQVVESVRMLSRLNTQTGTVGVDARYRFPVGKSGREMFNAAQAGGVQFEPQQRAWDPAVGSVYDDVWADGRILVKVPREVAELGDACWVYHWYRDVGDEIEVGQDLVMIQGQGSGFHVVTSSAAGRITEISTPSGEAVAVDDGLCVIARSLESQRPRCNVVT